MKVCLRLVFPAAIAASVAGAASCRGNQYTFNLPAAGQPPQAAVQSTTGRAVVSWTAVEEAAGYVIFVSTDGSPTPGLPQSECRGGGVASPCILDETLLPGQILYVRVAALVDGFDPTNFAQVEELPSMAVRPSYDGENPGPSVWAGLSQVTEKSVYLRGTWLTDAVDTTYDCRVFWGDAGDGGPGPIVPCTSEELAVSSGAFLDALYHEYPEAGTFYPLLDIGSDDGRFGQALTTVTRL